MPEPNEPKVPTNKLYEEVYTGSGMSPVVDVINEPLRYKLDVVPFHTTAIWYQVPVLTVTAGFCM